MVNMENRNQIEPDIEVYDIYGSVQFFCLTKRQFEVLKKFKKIQQLVLTIGNDQQLGEEVRKIIRINKGE